MSGKLNFYKSKLDGYKKFYQIVSTIKRIALSKYQFGIARVNTRDYTLRYSKKAFDPVFGGKEEEELCGNSTTFIPVGTNRGNCGPLNSANYRYLGAIIDQTGGKGVSIVNIGKKGLDAIPKLMPEHYQHSLINPDKQAKSFVWANFVSENAATVESDRTQIIFNRFVSAGSQVHAVYNIPSFEKFTASLLEASENEPAENSNYRMANALLDLEENDVRDFYEFHKSLVILNAVSENELSEHAARIIAVEGQLTNIAQLRDSTQMLFNKTRQGAITTALIEILSAMTAMADSQAGSGITKDEFWLTA
eukprot:TRINITY_DN4775_c3_g1_i1.p1 TRINITY_DN4775_c3_g1~~TRINITY_DN4775_c3_g1_i1.p1  ORF type:complete len:307 (+),score=77.22 TRINITY_DN4775_c3_g1_i1:55-975(+)